MGIVELFLVLTASITIFFIGLFTYFNNPKSVTNIFFTLFTLIVGIYLIVNYLALNQTIDSKTFIFVKSIMFLALLLNLTFFLLTTSYPKSSISISKPILWIVVTVTLLVLPLPYLNLVFSKIEIVNGKTLSTPGPAMPLFMVHTVGLLGGSFVSLIHKLRKSKGMERQKIRMFFLGAVVMFAFIILTNLAFVVFFNTTQFIGLLPIYVLVFILFIGYSIVKHKFLDINLLVARTTSYSLLLVVVVTFYTMVLYGSSQYLPEITYSRFIPVVLALVVAFSFNPTRKMLERATDKVFFKESYDTEKLLSKLTRIMAQELDLKKLSNRLANELIQAMKITKLAFVIIKNHKVIEVESNGFEDESKFYDYKLEELLHHDQNIFAFEELDDEDKKELFRGKDLAVVLPLKVKESEIGLLLLGPKASGEVYNSQDIGLLEIFAPQVSISIQNAQSYREIQAFSWTLEKKVEDRTKELELTQKRELAKANELLRLKDEFVFIATHDLRTPVTAIRGYVDIIRHGKEKLSDTIKQDFDAIMEASDRLNQLVNDLLQVARSESGTIKVLVEPVNLTELVGKSLKEVELTAQKRNIRVINELDSDQCYVMADKDKLIEVLENLFTNGIKYNRDGGTLTISSKEEGTVRLVTVADTGYGIPQPDQKQVFQKFFKSRTDETMEIPGTGLGLFVVRMLLEKMGGSISFESKEGEGTTFTFRLPSVRIG